MRVQNCYAYIAQAYHLMQNQAVHASLHATQYEASPTQMTDRVGAMKPSAKQGMIAQILSSPAQARGANSVSMFDLLGKVKAAVTFEQGMAVEQGTHLATMSFIESSRSMSISRAMGREESKKAAAKKDKMNMMTTPLERIVGAEDTANTVISESANDYMEMA